MLKGAGSFAVISNESHVVKRSNFCTTCASCICIAGMPGIARGLANSEADKIEYD